MYHPYSKASITPLSTKPQTVESFRMTFLLSSNLQESNDFNIVIIIEENRRDGDGDDDDRLARERRIRIGMDSRFTL